MKKNKGNGLLDGYEALFVRRCFQKCIGSHWHTLLPVSYTHLDVYKRQPEGSIPRSADMLVTIINSASTSLVAKTRQPAKSKTDSAVSYTHLDVYKRQDIIHGMTIYTSAQIEKELENAGFSKRCV